tara:strand:- start:397 stop:513 length:117 start_codon:yes stop_codon:yes gene_type:complete
MDETKEVATRTAEAATSLPAKVSATKSDPSHVGLPTSG